MIRTKGRRRLACHHEAGHALVRWFFGHRTDRAVVLTVEEVLAGVKVENRKGIAVECEGVVEGYDICGYPFGPIQLAGGGAEEAKFNRHRAIARDIELINCYAGFYAEALYSRVPAGEAMFAGGLADMNHARIVLDAWPLSAEERRVVELNADARAKALVRSPKGRAAIKAIADVLMDRGEIDGDEIAGLCRVAYDGLECAFGAWSNHWPPTLTRIRSGHIPEPPSASRAVA